jgi:metal-responsive CopG/Arc/MetJ family transcriptional regulator
VTARGTVSNVSDNVKRALIGVRLAPSSLAEVDRIAAEHDWTRSQVLRSLLRLGLIEWRKGKR